MFSTLKNVVLVLFAVVVLFVAAAPISTEASQNTVSYSAFSLCTYKSVRRACGTVDGKAAYINSTISYPTVAGSTDDYSFPGWFSYGHIDSYSFRWR